MTKNIKQMQDTIMHVILVHTMKSHAVTKGYICHSKKRVRDFGIFRELFRRLGIFEDLDLKVFVRDFQRFQGISRDFQIFFEILKDF